MSKKSIFGWMAAGAGLVAPAWAWAQEAAEAAAPEEGASALASAAQTFRDLWTTGGWIMYVLAALSVIGLAMVFYYLVVLRASAVAPATQALRLRDLLKDGRYRDAREACKASPTALAAVVGAALDFLKDNPKGQPEMLKEIMESEGARQAGRLQNLAHYLLDLSAVAPMIGLLGTVIGLLRAFNAVAFDAAQAQPVALAAGVGQALITTIAGLLIAIPAMVAYSIFRGHVSKLTGSLERASSDLYAVLAATAEPQQPKPAPAAPAVVPPATGGFLSGFKA